MAQNVLLIGGSLNQTTIVHKIAQQLEGYHCYFSPFFAEGFIGLLARLRLLNFTILGGNHRRNTERYFSEHNLPVDYGGRARTYDLVVITTDTYLPPSLLGKRMVLVQEGMIEPQLGLAYRLVRGLRLPRWLANTATTGLSHAYDVLCVASPGYRELFIHRGAAPEKVFVTGIPNFDHASVYLQNNFPHTGYVLAATSNARETLKRDNRLHFILEAQRIAAGRPLFFKLHPNEDFRRAEKEIRRYAPRARIFTDGDTHAMIANCEVLITQYSSVVYIGLALGKEVHSYLDINTLRQLAPIQNGGASAGRIAEICRQLLMAPLAERERVVRRIHKLESAWKTGNAR